MGLAFRPRSGAGQVDKPVQVIYSGAGVAVPSTFLGAVFYSPSISFGLAFGTTVTANASTDTLTIGSNGGRLHRAESVTFTTTGTLPAPLIPATQYTITNKGSGTDPTAWTTFQVADSGGAVIDLIDTGSGTHTARLGAGDLGSTFTIARATEGSCPSWAGVNPSDGVYTWTEFDAFVDYHYNQRGRQLLVTLNQTPTWAAPNSALDAYGYPGGGQAPTDKSTPADFCVELVNRYNKVSAANPSGNRMIWGIEMWNEPTHAALGTAGAFFCGTVSDLAEMTRHVSTQVGAADADCKILGPGYTSGNTTVSLVGAPNNLYAYLVASDGAGGQAKDHIDGASFHAYSMDRSSNAVAWAAQVANLRKLVTAAGLAADFPLYQTERGVENSADSYCHARSAVVLAALGVQMDITYTWDSFGANPRDNPATLSSLEIVRERLCGKTLTYCAIRQDGAVEFTANGVTTVI